MEKRKKTRVDLKREGLEKEGEGGGWTGREESWTDRLGRGGGEGSRSLGMACPLDSRTNSISVPINYSINELGSFLVLQ